MGQRKPTITGLLLRDGIWHYDKQVDGQRFRGSTGARDRAEAEKRLIELLADRQRRARAAQESRYTLREAMTRYLVENTSMPSIRHTASILKAWEPLVGDLELAHVCDETLAPAIKKLSKRLSPRSVNIGLQRIGRLLSLAARKWRDDSGKYPWMRSAPPILTMLDEDTDRAYPLSRDEQRHLFQQLPEFSATIAEFLVNTGCREQEALKLRWEYEIRFEGVGSVFVVPADFGGRTGSGGVKNGDMRVVVLNRVASEIVERQRGKNPMWVFAAEDTGKPMHQLNGKGWRAARERASRTFAEQMRQESPGLATVRVHDLKHTFGARLRAAGVAYSDRQDLLGHKRRSMTDHYSAADLERLIAGANSVIDLQIAAPTLTLIRRKAG